MKLDWVAVLSFLTGSVFLGLAGTIASLFPNPATGKIIIAVAGAIAQVAGVIKQATQPTVKIAQDAAVVSASGQQVGTNVSTTSTAPIMAPQKGS